MAPLYIDTPDDLDWQPPMVAQGAIMDCFICTTANVRALQRAFDRRYTAALPGLNVRMLPFLIFSFGKYAGAKSTSPNGDWAQRGSIAYREFAVWMLGMAMDDKVLPAGSLVVTLPYIYVDTHYAMAGAREIYGIQKKLGQITLAGDAPGGGWSCTTRGFAAYGPSKVSSDLTIVSISADLAAPTASVHLPATHSHAAHTVLGELAKIAAMPFERLLEAVHPSGSFIQPGGSPFHLLTLKQFRDYSNFAQAELQDLLWTGFEMQNLGFSLSLPGNQITLPGQADSDPIAHELGLRSPLTTLVRCRMTGDCVIGTSQALQMRSGLSRYLRR